MTMKTMMRRMMRRRRRRYQEGQRGGVGTWQGGR